MRTYELHSTFKDIKRSDGRSAVAAAAYRSGTRLVDERNGDVSDYTRKGGVEHSQLYAPALAPEWATNRQALWNAAQTKENRKNSMLARELEVGFPAEFSQQQRREAGGLIARRLVEKFGAAVDIAYHLPGKDGDSRNHHAHILFTGRSIDPAQPDGWAKNKYRDLNKDVVEVDGEKTLRSSVTAKEWKAFIADTFNQISTRDGLNVWTEHRSFHDRGLDKLPSVKLGPVASQIEREGKQSDRGNINRAIAATNALQQEIAEERRRLNLMVAKLNATLKDADEKPDPRARPEDIKREYEKYLNAAEKAIKEETERRSDAYAQARKAWSDHHPEPAPPFDGWTIFDKLAGKPKKFEQERGEWAIEEKRLRFAKIDAERASNEQPPQAKALAETWMEKDKPELYKEWKRIQALKEQESTTCRDLQSKYIRPAISAFSGQD